MSYFLCPDCGKKHKIFGESHIDEIAAKHGIINVAKLPMDPEVAKAADNGTIEDINLPEIGAIADAIKAL